MTGAATRRELQNIHNALQTARTETDAALEAVIGLIDRTGPPPRAVCSINASGWTLGHTCDACGHTGMVHPGVHTGLAACLLCELQDSVEQARALRDEIAGLRDWTRRKQR